MSIKENALSDLSVPKKKLTNEELVTRIKVGIDTADNMALLWQQNRGMIHLIAKRYQHYESIEDLEQEGFIGLCKAVEHYDPDAGTAFISYATYWIKHTIYRYLEENGHIVRIPVHTHSMIRKYKKVCLQFEQQLNREPTVKELSRYLDISIDQVEKIQKDMVMTSIGSLDEALPLEDSGLTVGDAIASPEDLEADVIEDMAAGQLKTALWGMVDSLEGNCAAAIRYRYQDNLTLKETGKAMGISLDVARTWQSKGLRRLRSRQEMMQLGRDYGYIQSHAYRDSGLAKFRNTWTSSTEYTALELFEQEMQG